jgi:hypothetical protein
VKSIHEANRTGKCYECGGVPRRSWNNKPLRHCDDCHKDYHEVKQAAAAALGTALRHGLVRPYHGAACVDCGAPAQCLEHRDYTQPLAVEPCCRSCNMKRPPARWRESQPRFFLPVIPNSGSFPTQQPESIDCACKTFFPLGRAEARPFAGRSA